MDQEEDVLWSVVFFGWEDEYLSMRIEAAAGDDVTALSHRWCRHD
jgi:hypothetical protein